MALLSINSNSSYGFNAFVEIDRALFSHRKTFVTETKTVDGMPDVKWSIKVYPIDPKEPKYFGIYACIESEKEIEYNVKGNKGTCKGDKVEQRIDYGELRYYLDPSNTYFKDGKRKYEVNAAFSYKENSNNILKIYNSNEWGLRLKENSSEDFKIVVGGEIFQIHKLIIAAESPVFKKMFNDDFKEARECKVDIIDTDAQTVKAFIDYCYGQNVTPENDIDKINLLYFSDKYDCQTLKPQLESHLASNISKETLSLFVTTADKANALQLRQACIEFVRKIIHVDGSLTAEEMDSFDLKFTKDVFAFNPSV